MTSFSGLFNNAALMLILCVIYDTFGVYSLSNKNLRYCLTGVLAGFISIVVMLNPWSLQPGVFFDTRWVLLSLCGLFFGFIPTAIAVTIAGAFRLYQGGPGGTVGTLVIVVTACVGIGWRFWQKRYERPLGWKELYLFGLLVQVAMLSCMFFMPVGMRFTIIKAVAPPILIIYPVLTMLIGLILKRQEIRRDTEKELEQSRKALSREKGLLRGVINAIPDLIYYKDTEGKYLGCNKSFEAFVGSREQDVVGRSVYELFDEETARPFHQMDQEVFNSGRLVSKEVWVASTSGEKVFLDTVKTPFNDLGGSLHGLVGISRDFTDRKKVESKLAAEKERLAVTLRSIGDGVITTDVEGNVVMLNTVAEQLTGWSQEEACGRPLAEIFHIINEDSREICVNPATKVIASGEIVELVNHTVLIAKDGTQRSIADSGAPIFDIENNIIGVVLVFRDVTNQIKMENELLKVEKLESIGILAGGIAHDFNNILAAILGNINLALFDQDLHNKTRGILQEAEKASLRAKELTQQLLTFAKGGHPVKELSSLEHVIKDSADFVLRGDKVACRYNIPKDLWAVEIDRGQIGQAIQNIVLNASQAMVEGGVINISCKNVSPSLLPDDSKGKKTSGLQCGKYVEIIIQDSGTGMATSVVEKIFDPYFSTKNEGSGLGLTITHSIIEKHNGFISIQSTPGIGTAVTVRLPAASEKLQERPGDESIRKTVSPLKILIMDDDEMVQDVTKKMLVKLGHKVEIAERGEEAIALYRNALDTGNRYDLIIMDLTIPGGMGGKETVGKIKVLDPEAKVIVSSGYSNDPVMAKFEEYGFCAAIVKPYALKNLSRVLSQVVS